jgi:hypothetical protein
MIRESRFLIFDAAAKEALKRHEGKPEGADLLSRRLSDQNGFSADQVDQLLFAQISKS